VVVERCLLELVVVVHGFREIERVRLGSRLFRPGRA
jgi:hypothetical protein